MTEKQFKSFRIGDEFAYIEIDGIQCYVDVGDDVIIEDKLNKLFNEKEQLKADNNRLVNETAKIIGENQKRVLDLIDKKIKELKNINNVSIIPRESIEVLEQLKKELQE